VVTVLVGFGFGLGFEPEVVRGALGGIVTVVVPEGAVVATVVGPPVGVLLVVDSADPRTGVPAGLVVEPLGSVAVAVTCGLPVV
jgi:hypothetical protein